MEAIEAKLTQYLNERQAKFVRQFVSYFGVALIGLGVDFGTLVFLREAFGVHYLLAAVGGFTAGLAVNYALSSRYVFKNSKLRSRTLEFALFGVIGLIGLGILSASMWVLTDALHMHYVLSKVFATIAVYMWNFFGRKALYHD
jgi:putative flippase GtrA